MSDDYYLGAVIVDLEKEVKKLKEENFTLAAGQCLHEKGILGDDHGHPYCPLESFQWISVEDRLPEKLLRVVLVYYPPGTFEDVPGYLIEITLAEHVIEKPKDYPYWMPLPEPPE